MPNKAADVNGLLLRELKDTGSVVRLEFIDLGRGGRAAAFRAVVNGLLLREPKNVNAVVLRKLFFDLGRGGRAAALRTVVNGLLSRKPKDTDEAVLLKFINMSFVRHPAGRAAYPAAFPRCTDPACCRLLARSTAKPADPKENRALRAKRSKNQGASLLYLALSLPGPASCQRAGCAP
jgi:hypothetical protein